MYLREGTKNTKSGLGKVRVTLWKLSAQRHKEHQSGLGCNYQEASGRICATAQDDQKQHKKTKAD
jgi:hypothetical protein